MTKIESKNLVIRTPNWLGDAVMSLWTIKTIKMVSPETRITILTKNGLDEIYKIFKVADEVYPFDAKHGFFGMFRESYFIKDLASKNFDTALTIPNSFHSARIFYKAKIPVIIGFAKFLRNYMLTHKLKLSEDARIKHRVEKIFQLTRFFGLSKISDIKLQPEMNEDLKNYAINVLKENNVCEEDILIGINAGAQYGWSKQWPINYFIALCKKLIEYNKKCKIFLFGNPNDSATNKKIKSSINSDNVIDFSGKTNLSQLSSILLHCKILVTNDTGTMHLANLLSVKIIAIFGSTSHLLTGPYLKPYVVIKHDVDCSPCFLRYCPIDHRCMRNIPPERVFIQCKEWIEKQKSTPKTLFGDEIMM